MANAVVTIKIMPTSPDVDMEALKIAVKEKIVAFAGEGETRDAIEPVAFGLKSLNIRFVMDEALGSPDAMEEGIQAIEGVNSFEVTDVRRALG